MDLGHPQFRVCGWSSIGFCGWLVSETSCVSRSLDFWENGKCGVVVDGVERPFYHAVMEQVAIQAVRPCCSDLLAIGSKCEAELPQASRCSNPCARRNSAPQEPSVWFVRSRQPNMLCSGGACQDCGIWSEQLLSLNRSNLSPGVSVEGINSGSPYLATTA